MYRKALVITRNYSLQMILRSVFSKEYGYQAAANVMQALPLLKQDTDLVILDLDDNYEDGVDFIHHLQSSLLYQAPVLVLSSSDTATELETIYNDVKVFKKPFNPLQLLKAADLLFSAVAG